MDNNCDCGGALSTSQTIVPVKKTDGLIWYQTQRRCSGCFKVVTVSESLTPPFPEGD